ncbi:60S acidic ribosomal protein [Perkinsus chesapeaki]|uniref:60S acidic ribosomal protein n=1 Tax=Perkinsus chesapeaki TaxID=330153 RepID=A0A7J6L7X0_PERCH|nr:60S acidic ribosomal protein [Perkinsus chesapeaki]
MAAVPTNDLPGTERDELLCTYAALICHDSDVEITSDNLNALIHASGARHVESYWPVLFARMLKGKDVSEMLSAAGSVGAVAGAAPAAGAAAAGAEAAPAEEAKPAEEEEEEDEDMGFDLFD